MVSNFLKFFAILNIFIVASANKNFYDNATITAYITTSPNVLEMLIVMNHTTTIDFEVLVDNFLRNHKIYPTSIKSHIPTYTRPLPKSVVTVKNSNQNNIATHSHDETKQRVISPRPGFKVIYLVPLIAPVAALGVGGGGVGSSAAGIPAALEIVQQVVADVIPPTAQRQAPLQSPPQPEVDFDQIVPEPEFSPDSPQPGPSGTQNTNPESNPRPSRPDTSRSSSFNREDALSEPEDTENNIFEPSSSSSEFDTSQPAEDFQSESEDDFGPSIKKARLEEEGEANLYGNQESTAQEESLNEDIAEFGPNDIDGQNLVQEEQSFELDPLLTEPAPGASLVEPLMEEFGTSLENLRDLADRISHVVSDFQEEIRHFGLGYINEARRAGLLSNIRRQIQRLRSQASNVQVANINMEAEMMNVVRRVSDGRTENDQLEIIHEIENEQQDIQDIMYERSED